MITVSDTRATQKYRYIYHLAALQIQVIVYRTVFDLHLTWQRIENINYQPTTNTKIKDIDPGFSHRPIITAVQLIRVLPNNFMFSFPLCTSDHGETCGPCQATGLTLITKWEKGTNLILCFLSLNANITVYLGH